MTTKPTSTVITSTGMPKNLLVFSTSDMLDASETGADFFSDHFNGLIDDVFYGDATIDNYSSKLLTGTGYGGSYTVLGSGFTGLSGTITHVDYSGDGGNLTLDGALRWNANDGIYSGTIHYVEAHYGSSGFSMTGSLTADADGNPVGTVTQLDIFADGVTFEMTGSINIAAMTGTLTKFYVHDDAGNSYTMTGKYDYATFNEATEEATMFSAVFDTPALFAGDDTLKVVDGAHSWHGFEGNDKLTGGALNDVLFGDDGNDTLDGSAGADILYGGTGNDVFYVDSSNDIIVENDAEGVDTINSSASFDLSINGAFVENLVLTGKAAINATGNELANTLTGNDADNILDGGAGDDHLNGGKGNDTYIVDSLGDVITDSAGIDTVQASISYTLGKGLEVLQLTGSDDLTAIGNTGINTLIGNDGNNVLDGGAGVDTMSGGLGDDTYYVDNAKDIIIENAHEGTDTVFSLISYILSDDLENLTLTGTKALNGTGNALDNIITGNAGINTLDGGDGVDTLAGGAGNDVYIVDTQTDLLQEDANGGTDTVRSSVNFTLDDNFENLVLTAPGHSGTGNALVNTLTGTAGDDTLDGAGGADKMFGGDGNDTYYVDNAQDMVTDTKGTDTVYASVSWTLAANIEIMTLTGHDAINATGNTLNNLLYGNDAANVLDGGKGNDTLWGGLGDDTYVVDAAGDVVHEDFNAGHDTVQASVSYTLVDNLENLVLTGTGAINGTGNDLDNTIIGNKGANILNGGDGADFLIGGAGNDTYIVNNHDATLVENAKEGTDTVRASVDYVLLDNFENLVLTGYSLAGTGNGAANSITGTNGDDSLDGMGGADVLIGGLGNDHYSVDDAHDKVTEGLNGGTDTINSTVDWTLGANIENLELSGNAITGKGNALANYILGNDHANNLFGMDGNDTLNGGLGADTLTGGKGADVFAFSHTDAADTITDFSLADGDKIDLRDVLAGHDDVATHLADLVHVTTGGTGSAVFTTISVDVDGMGHYADVAILQHVNTTLQSLLDAHAIVVE